MSSLSHMVGHHVLLVTNPPGSTPCPRSLAGQCRWSSLLCQAQSSTRPENWPNLSFISSLAWPTAVRIRSRTSQRDGYKHWGNVVGCISLIEIQINHLIWLKHMKSLTLFRDRGIIHPGLPLLTKFCQPLCLTDYHWPDRHTDRHSHNTPIRVRNIAVDLVSHINPHLK